MSALNPLCLLQAQAEQAEAELTAMKSKVGGWACWDCSVAVDMLLAWPFRRSCTCGIGALKNRTASVMGSLTVLPTLAGGDT